MFHIFQNFIEFCPTVHHSIEMSLNIFLSLSSAPFIAGLLTDQIGRKWVLLSNSIFTILGYVLVMIGGEVWVLLLGRLIQGFGAGFVMTTVPMYVGEIATVKIRGALGSLMNLFIVCKFYNTNSKVLYNISLKSLSLYFNFSWCSLCVRNWAICILSSSSMVLPCLIYSFSPLLYLDARKSFLFGFQRS